MRKSRTLATLGGLVLIPAAASAQEALRTTVSADRALARPRPVSVQGEEGMRWGPVQFSAGTSLSLEYDDNIRAGGAGREQQRDFIIRPRADLTGVWPVTETSALTAGVGVGYAFYLDHSEYDYLEISPTSALSYSVSIEDLVLTVYDQISYTGDVLDQPEITGQARYPRLENTVGLRASYPISDWLLQAGYAYYRYWAFDDDYKDLERGSHQPFARVGYLVAERTQVGVESTISLTEYTTTQIEPTTGTPLRRNDYNSFSFGPYVEWTIINSLTVGARGGYVIYTYKDTGINVPVLEDQTSWYVGLNVSHDLTEYISQTLSATRDVGVGIDSQYIERFDLSYGINWQMTEAWDIGAGVSYGKGKERGQIAREEYDIIGFNAGVGYQFSDHLRASLAYRYQNRMSNEAGGDYDRNVVGLTVSYRF